MAKKVNIGIGDDVYMTDPDLHENDVTKNTGKDPDDKDFAVWQEDGVSPDVIVDPDLRRRYKAYLNRE